MAATATPTTRDYEVLETLGKGTFGKVSRVRRRSDGQVFVWKEMRYDTMSEKEKQLIVQEVNLLQRLNHPNIVHYVDRIVDKAHATLFIIMECCDGGDLAHLIRKCRREGTTIAEEVIWKVLLQLAQALAECHHHREGVVLHRDIKPGNVFLDLSNNVKLGDFGLARILGHESVYAQTYVGTPYYMSPEQVLGRPYNEKSDVWSLGCLVFELAALAPPFEASSKPMLEQRIRSGVHGRLPPRYSVELNNAISGMLCVDSRRRASVDDVLRLPQVAVRARHVVVSGLIGTTGDAATTAVVVPNAQDQQQHRRAATTAVVTAPAPVANQQSADAAMLETRTRELDAREQALNARERSIEARERDVAKREADLIRKEQQQTSCAAASAAAVPRGVGVYRTTSAGMLAVAAKENARPTTAVYGLLHPLSRPY